MTRINKIVMHGFKSFARRTELLFGEGFNAVLGPNGSGKSNVIDALCFVLGRLSSKALRAEKAANLVYNGGKTKKPMKQGEVSIFFDNSEKTFPTEDPFVKITRIIKQDGQSIYKINDQRRTRQQILDLMAVAKIDPEGYNIILQGDIVRFTEMHPEDRRMLIEEISGISVYEDKKKKALRELEKVEEKLKEAEIVLAERAAHLKELKRERDQALKFKELESRVKENKASYLYIQIERQEKKKAKLTKRIQEHEIKIKEFNDKIDSIKQIIEEKRKAIENITHEIEEKGEKEQVSMQREIEDLKVGLATNKTRIENCRNEIDKIIIRKKGFGKDLKELDGQIEELKSKREELEKEKPSKLGEINRLDSQLQRFKQDNAIEDAAEIEGEIERIEKQAEERQKEIEELRQEQQDMLRKKDSLEFQINSVDERIEKVHQIEEEHKDQIDELKNKKEELKNGIVDLNQRLNEDSSLAVQTDERKRKLAACQEELAKLNARNASIKENAIKSFAVKSILERKDKGVYGTVGGLGNVDSKYAVALEVAAGPRLNSVVVEDDGVAADWIKYLKKNKLGIATFLPLNKIKSRVVEARIKELAKKEGVHGFAIDLVSFDTKFKKIFSYVFGNTLVVEDIDIARKIGIGKARMVTLDGDMAEISGAMQGGSRKIKGTGFKERDVLKGIEGKTVEISEQAKALSSLESRRKENEDLITRLREKRAELEGEIIKGEKSLHLESGDIESSNQIKQELGEQVKEVDEELAKVEEKISGVNKELSQAKTDKQELRSRISEIRNPALLAELNTFEEKKTQLKEEAMQLEADIRNIGIEINDMKIPEKERMGNIIKQNNKELEGFEQEIKDLAEKVEEDRLTLQQKEKAAQEFQAKHKELFAKRNKLGDEIQQEEKGIDDLREGAKKEEIEMNTISLQNAEVKGKLAGLKEEFGQYEGVKINREKSEEELKKDIGKFEKMVQDIGSVNMRALEIYETVEKEYQSLLDKKDRLSKEKEDVFGMMKEIEGRKKELFMRTFDVINENFKNVFSALSTKGDASLELENPEEPFEAGLHIKVRIVGKKFLDIRSLSGGEKTLTALAFIFAIQEYEPHSFYIMDEVDAALDKHNSEKLSMLLRKYVENAQYIIISHNDAIISEADNLYGVSMNEHGISNVTSLKI